MLGLSILIPTFNDECASLVSDLLRQCRRFRTGTADGWEYEIVVADDGSTDSAVVAANAVIATQPRCRLIMSGRNSGRAAIRNSLAREARYDRLLFIDSDMTVIRRDFISRYAEAASSAEIVYGGYDVPAQNGLDGNLRYIYERASRFAHTADKRRLNPYRDFHTSNFMIPRAVMLAHPLDEHFRHYGYEDVAYGEELRKAGIGIRHIDNPMGFCRFESNAGFVSKTEEGLHTLAGFRDRLEGYSRLLALVSRLDRLHLTAIVRGVLSPLMPVLRNNLMGRKPSLKAFSLYKLGYLLRLLQTSGTLS